MIFFLFALLLLTVSQTSQLAQPKGFTDDPYVDDEKFIEKGELALTVSDIFNISQGLKYHIGKISIPLNEKKKPGDFYFKKKNLKL